MKHFRRRKCKSTFIKSKRQSFSFALVSNTPWMNYGGLALHILKVCASWRWPSSCPSHFTPTESAPGTHCIGGWVVRQRRSEGFREGGSDILPCWESNLYSSVVSPLDQSEFRKIQKLASDTQQIKLKTRLSHKGMFYNHVCQPIETGRKKLNTVGM
jgi:hypothetical protein